jgi:hypothetical protein
MAIGAEVAHSLAAALMAVAHEATLLAREMATTPSGVPLHLWATRTDLQKAAASRVVEDFLQRGWVSRSASGVLSNTGTSPQGLADFLTGVAAMASVRPEVGTFKAVVTSPPDPSSFSRALLRTGMARVDLVDTSGAMHEVAAAAVRRLTIMTPFGNVPGLTYVAELFACTPAPERTLLLRVRDRQTKLALAELREQLNSQGVRVLNYFIDLGDGAYETFHAKVVLADEQVAYVGSANMLLYARHSMEMGVLVRGPGTEVVAAAVRAAEMSGTPA